MANESLKCLRCERPLSLTRSHANGPIQCVACGLPMDVHVFPAYFQGPVVVDTGQRLVIDDEASCFNHPQKRAEQACSVCGRFLCRLCATEFNNQPTCLTCLTQAQTNSQDSKLEKGRMLYDDLALSLALVPVLAWPLTLVTAPASLFIVLFYWRKGPTSVIKRTRIRYVLAFILAALQMTGWVLVFINMII